MSKKLEYKPKLVDDSRVKLKLSLGTPQETKIFMTSQAKVYKTRSV